MCVCVWKWLLKSLRLKFARSIVRERKFGFGRGLRSGVTGPLFHSYHHHHPPLPLRVVRKTVGNGFFVVRKAGMLTFRWKKWSIGIDSIYLIALYSYRRREWEKSNNKFDPTTGGKTTTKMPRVKAQHLGLLPSVLLLFLCQHISSGEDYFCYFIFLV